MEIIDSLRIILDDDKVKDKLIVITAVDDRILQRAVEHKYKGIDGLAMADLIKEYMDKLFIFSVKLGALAESESQEFFSKLIKDDLAKPKELDLRSKSQNESLGTDNVNGPSLPATDYSPVDFITKSAHSELELFENLVDFTSSEADIFNRNLKWLFNATPRKLKILYYRYRLARNLLIIKYSTETKNGYWLTEGNLEQFIQALILFTNVRAEKIDNEIARILEHEHEIVELNTSLKTNAALQLKLNRIEYLELLKILRIVVAY